MIDIKRLRENPDLLTSSIERRQMGPHVDVEKAIDLDRQWREQAGKVEALRAERNQQSTAIKKLDGDQRAQAIARVKQLKAELESLETEAASLSEQREQALKSLPNVLMADVPDGQTDEDNVEVARWGEPRKLDFDPRDHLALGTLTDTIDFARGAKTVGRGFYYLKREAALLEMALCRYVADQLMPHQFIPVSTPDLCRDAILEGIGFAPRGPETQIYSIADKDLSLVATAEITLGGYHADEILDAAQLPLKYLGFSHCFRTEAGAHGKESRGLYRVHQFTKAELFVICSPSESEKIHEEIRSHEESIMQNLGIPYRVVNVCAGDLGAPAAKKYDIEAWMPGRNAYGEVTSCSNCTDFQARRLNVRFREDKDASPQFVHMLNGTAVAISRTLLAIYENYQHADGSIGIPEVLRPYLGGIDHIPARAA